MAIVLLIFGLALVVSALAIAYYTGKIKALDDVIAILDKIDSSRGVG